MAKHPLVKPPQQEDETFHPFPLLPPELRIKIWEAACLSSFHKTHGIHYVDVDCVQFVQQDLDDDTFDENMEGGPRLLNHHVANRGSATLRALKSNWNTSLEKSDSVTYPNRSAYMWDAGLWMACQESRAIVAKHMDLEHWVELRKDGNRLDSATGWGELDFPSTLVPHQKDGMWRPIVVPHKDIFCINTGDVELLPLNLYRMQLYAPFLGTRKFTVLNMPHANIALEYQSSWNNDLPSSICGMAPELSPRSALSHWLSMFIDDQNDLDTVYRDCDGDYVRVGWIDTRKNAKGRSKGDVTEFIDAVGKLCDIEYHAQVYGGFDIVRLLTGGDPVFRTRRHLKLLVRRDNEVKECEEELLFLDPERDGSDDDGNEDKN
ncbi:hypothetical protein F53441_803 [Fusarium austroafricanum]|uniref:2EXR domain-containing protein n=1 Tax=Fusarium austroafricanum TaxID=2364996 RepID=A0A8H4KX53_9HYPO|nr:hypothetical protein F53441_803 [Fusarium austroafricanum]